jgi:GNAT superfamily N-acetyltransferase
MMTPSRQPHPVLRDVERLIQLEMEMTKFNNERSLYLKESHFTVTQIGGTTLLLDELSPLSSYYNRVIGFGPADLERLPEILGKYAASGIDPCFDLSPDRKTSEVAEALAAKGFVPRLQLAFLKHEFDKENLGLESSERAQSREGIHMAQVSNEAEALAFIQLIERSRGGDGSSLDEGMVKRKIRYYYRDDFRNYVASLGGEPAGMGSLFVRGDTGYLANDYTFPAYRNRGIQTSLIRYRLQTARKLGLKRVYTDVEFASASHANMLKCGFELVYMNTFWMKTALPR